MIDDSTWSKATQNDIKSGKIIKRTINGFDYYFPKLVNRPTTSKHTESCIYCKNRTFRYFRSHFGKKYYQCEKCFGIN